MTIHASEQWVNLDEGYSSGETGVYPTYCETVGELYRASMKEYGRCTSKVYVDDGDKVRAVGWVFLKRKQYDDSADTFLMETWVTVHSAPPTETTEYHYQDV